MKKPYLNQVDRMIVIIFPNSITAQILKINIAGAKFKRAVLSIFILKLKKRYGK